MGRLLAQQQGAEWAKRRLKAGVACARRKQLDQALQLYESALQLCPYYADALIARGAAYANKVRKGENVLKRLKELSLQDFKFYWLKFL